MCTRAADTNVQSRGEAPKKRVFHGDSTITAATTEASSVVEDNDSSKQQSHHNNKKTAIFIRRVLAGLIRQIMTMSTSSSLTHSFGFLPLLLVLLLLVLQLQPTHAQFHHKGPKGAYNDYQPGDTTVIDNFNQPAILEKISDPNMWVTCDEKGKMWQDWGTKPKNIWQVLNLLIWKDHPEIKTAKANNKTLVGFEYWCNRTSNRSPLQGTWWQVIIDDANETHPVMGAVYFGFPHNVQGGMMDITPTRDRFDTDLEEPHKAKYFALDNKVRPQFVQHIEPEFNRLITFNASKWHGCHSIEKGWRFQFVTNLWSEKPKPAPPPPTPEEIRIKRVKKLKAAYKEYQAGDTTVIDNFGEDSLLGKLRDDQLWDKCVDKGRRWFDWDAEPKSLWQMLSKLIWQVHPEVKKVKAKDETFAGYEYWCVKMSEYDHDHDTPAFRIEIDQARVTHPVMAAYYWGYQHEYRKDMEGGTLQILTQEDRSTMATAEEAEEYETKNRRNRDLIKRVDPKYDRLVTFNASKWHEISKVYEGDYYMLMVNLWKDKPKTMKDLKKSSYSYGDSDEDNEGTHVHDEF